jgi:hypothetical protein
MTTRIKTYSELMSIESFVERFRYLRLNGIVSNPTFGFDRWINQDFYASRQWKQARSYVISRDLGCDLAIPGYEIHSEILVHHMNPMEVDDIVDGDPATLDPEFLITTTHRTHNAIHYGDERHLPRSFVERKPGDTKLW